MVISLISLQRNLTQIDHTWDTLSFWSGFLGNFYVFTATEHERGVKSTFSGAWNRWQIVCCSLIRLIRNVSVKYMNLDLLSFAWPSTLGKNIEAVQAVIIDSGISFTIRTKGSAEFLCNCFIKTKRFIKLKSAPPRWLLLAANFFTRICLHKCFPFASFILIEMKWMHSFPFFSFAVH